MKNFKSYKHSSLFFCSISDEVKQINAKCQH
jgi:hypothetical protein